MKLIKTLLILISLSLLACHKQSGLDNAIIGSRNDPAGLLSASIDGKPWIASLKYASIMNGAITISGTDSTGQTIALSLNDTIMKDYVLNQKTVSVARYTDSTMYLQNFSTTQSKDPSLAGGKVIVTAIDHTNKTITGTFTLNLYCDSGSYKKTVTQGNFINLPYITELPPAKSTDTFYVQIDGVNWIPESIAAGIVERQILVTGSTRDGSRSVSIDLPQYLWSNSYEDFAVWPVWGSYVNGAQSYSTIKLLPQPDGTVYLSSYPGNLYVVEDDPSRRRLRVSFQFQAVTPSGSSSIQMSNGYFSVQY